MKQWIKNNKGLAITLLCIIIVVAGALDLIFKGLLYQVLALLF